MTEQLAYLMLWSFAWTTYVSVRYVVEGCKTQLGSTLALVLTMTAAVGPAFLALNFLLGDGSWSS